MKPNGKQIAACTFIEKNARYWQHTNDISSPTHQGDLNEEVKNVQFGEDILTDEEQKELANKMNDLLQFIRKL